MQIDKEILSEIIATHGAYEHQIGLMDSNGIGMKVENWKRDYVKHVSCLLSTIEGLKGEVEVCTQTISLNSDLIHTMHENNNLLRAEVERYRTAIEMIKFHNGSMDAYDNIERIIEGLGE